MAPRHARGSACSRAARILRKVKDDPTITRADLDRLVKAALEDFAWADEVRLAANGRHFDVRGPAPADFDQIALESWADEYRTALARNDIAPVRHLIGKYARRLELEVAAGSVDERLVGRALLRALAQSCDDAAETFRREVRPHLPGLDTNLDLNVDAELEAFAAMDAVPTVAQADSPPSWPHHRRPPMRRRRPTSLPERRRP